MPDSTPGKAPTHRFSIRTLFGWVGAFAISLTPIGFFGWKGIVSAVCLLIAAVFWLLGKRVSASLLIVLLLFGQFFYPVLDGARETTLRSECESNLRQLTIAIHNYESKHGHLPPPFSTDSDGNVLHSWRVLILPFLGEQQLYDQIDKSKRWDDPVNAAYHKRMPDIFCCSAKRYHSKWGFKSNTTAYVVVVGEATAWRANDPPSLVQISDRTSRTIAIIESETHRTNWMCPNDPNLDSFVNSFQFHRPHDGIISLFDASTVRLPGDTTPDQIRNMLTIDNGR